MGGNLSTAAKRVLRAALALVLAIGLCPLPTFGGTAWAEQPQASGDAAAQTGTVSSSGLMTGSEPTSTDSSTSANPTNDAPSALTGSSGTDSQVQGASSASSEKDAGSTSSAAPAASADPALAPQGTDDTSPYGVYVGGVAVTDANKDNVLAKTPNAGKVKYVPGTPTDSARLILGDGSGTPLTITGVLDFMHGAAIYSQHDLTITVVDPTTLCGTSSAQITGAGLIVTGCLDLKGAAGLTAIGGTGTKGTVNSSYSAGICSSSSMTVSGIPTLTATGGDGNSVSLGIYVIGAPSRPGNLTISNGTQVTATGGSGTSMSFGICSSGRITLNDSVGLKANGARCDGGKSFGVRSEALILNGRASAEAYGDVAMNSTGIDTSRVTSSDGVSVKLADGTSLIAQGADATQASYGIDNTTGIVDVAGGATLGVAAGEANTTEGTSMGITGQLVYAGGTGTDGSVTVSCGTAATAKALGTAPQLASTEYRWKTDTQTDWQYGATKAFSYTGTELTVFFAQTSFPLWVGGTQVNMANKDNVLADTANDGKVDFTPGVGSSELGVLGLDGANISGAADTRTGAGIYATKGLQIVASEDNTVTGAAVADGENTGIHASALTIGGYGSLHITSADAATGGHATALDIEGAEDATHSTAGSLIIQNRVTITATAQAGTGSGVISGDLTFADTIGPSSLTAMGGHSVQGNPALSSVGVSCYGTITQLGHNTLTGIGGEATNASFGIFCASATVSGSDDASLVGIGGAVSETGASYGIECSDSAYGLALSGGCILLRSDSTVGTHVATNVVPRVGGYAAYRWRTGSAAAWNYSAKTPFAFDTSKAYLQITPPMGNLWVGGVKVTTQNMADILGDGTATFTPYGAPMTTSSALSTESGTGTLTPQKTEVVSGILTLKNAKTSGVEDMHNGAAIYSDEPLRVLLQGGSTLVGADSASGDAYGIHIAGAAIFGGSGTLSVKAGNAGDGNAVGILSDKFSDELAGMLVALESTSVDSQGGTVAKTSESDPHGSLGVMGEQTVFVQDNATLRATGSVGEGGTGAVLPSSCIGIFTDDLQVHDNATVDAQGLYGQTSVGAVVTKNLVLNGSALLSADGSGGTAESYGIGAGTEAGIYLEGGLLTARASGSEGATVSALSDAPTVDMALYHWRTGEYDGFTLSPPTAYAYDADQTYVQIGSAYDLTVGGVRVTETNKGNVLAGTANDGKVSFTLDGNTGTQGVRGTLHLSGATLAGVSGKDYGAGIYSGLSNLTLDLSGSNTVTGAPGSIPDKLACGIQAVGLTLRSAGSLDVKAADMPQTGGNRSYGVHGFVTVTGDAVATFTGGAADESAGLNGSLTMSSLGNLTCTGGTGSKASYGAKLVGLRMDTQSQFTATGGSAATSAGVSEAGLKANISGDASLTATGGRGTTASYGYRSGEAAALVAAGTASITLRGGRSTGTSQASSSAMDLSGHDPYRWKSESVGQWTDSSVAPYAYSATDMMVSVMRADFYPVWVGGVQVCDANRADVLEGTANEGKVTFVPAHDGQAAVLQVDGADIAGASGEHAGAGIYSELPITLRLSGSNSVTGGQPGSLFTVCGIMVQSALDIVGDGDLDVTAADGELSFGIGTQDGLSVGESAFVTSHSGTASVMSAGALASTSLDVCDDGYLAASAGVGGDSAGIYTDALHVRDQAIVLGNGARSANPNGFSDGVFAGTVSMEGGALSGISDQGATSYGIDTDQTPGSLVVTGGTIIGIAQGTPNTTVGAFSQAADVSGYDGYKWRNSSTGSYAYGGYTYNAADTYEEITAGIAPAPTPTPVEADSAATTAPSTGDALGVLPFVLGAAALLAAGTLVAAARRRRKI